MWNNNIFHIAHISHYQPPPNVHTCTTTWRPKRISTTHISCTLRLQHSWTDGRSKCTHHGGPLSTNCCLFFCEQRRTNCNRKKIYIYPRICSPFFLYSNMVRPRWVQQVIFVPFVGCFSPSPFVLLQHSLSVLFKPNYTQGKPLRILESFFVWTFDLSHTCNQNDTIHNNSRCGYPR